MVMPAQLIRHNLQLCLLSLEFLRPTLYILTVRVFLAICVELLFELIEPLIRLRQCSILFLFASRQFTALREHLIRQHFRFEILCFELSFDSSDLFFETRNLCLEPLRFLAHRAKLGT